MEDFRIDEASVHEWINSSKNWSHWLFDVGLWKYLFVCQSYHKNNFILSKFISFVYNLYRMY
jgi:hypothetical protein